MHPKFIVWLQDSQERMVAHEFFFSERNAKRSYRKAMNSNSDGFRELAGELGSCTQVANVDARFLCFGKYVSTSKDPRRMSFLNLESEEENELTEIYGLPVEIFRELSKLEKAIAEKKRYSGRPYSERTYALIRKHAPQWFSRFIYYSKLLN